jgi:dihydroflavonol-4-reductase
MMRTLLHGHAYDGERAHRELGLDYTPIEDTLRRTLAWYVEQGVVTRPLPAFSSPISGQV